MCTWRLNFQIYLSLIHDFLSPYLHKKKMLAPEKNGLAPELFLFLSNDRGIRCADHTTPSIRKSWRYFANKLRSLGRHSSLADQSHVVLVFFVYPW
jgi:hypothetical protein